MQTLKELKEQVKKKTEAVSLRFNDKESKAEVAIGTKNVSVTIDDKFRFTLVYDPKVNYLEHPVIRLVFNNKAIIRHNHEGTWKEVDFLPVPFRDSVIRLLPYAKAYWEEYLLAKQKKAPIYFVGALDAHAAVKEQLKESFNPKGLKKLNSINPEDIRPIQVKLLQKSGFFLSELPEVVFEEGRAYQKMQQFIMDYFNHQPLLHPLKRSEMNVVEEAIVFRFSDTLFTLVASPDFQHLLISEKKEENAKAWTIEPTFEGMQSVLDEILYAHRTLHLINPPKDNFKKLVEAVVSNRLYVSDQNIDDQFNELAARVGSWQKAEALSSELTRIAKTPKANEFDELYSIYDRFGNRSLLIDRIHYEDTYYFIVITKEKGKETLELYLSDQPLYKKMGEKTKRFFESTCPF